MQVGQLLSNKVFTYKKPFLYKEIAKFYGVINAEIVESTNTRNTVVYLLQVHGSSMMPLYEKFIDLSDSSISFGIYPFGFATTQELTKIRSQVPLQYELRAFEYLFKQNKLNAYVINAIKGDSLSRYGPFLAKMQDYKKRLCFQSFINLKPSPEANTTREAHPIRKKGDFYLLLERYLGYIQEWMPEYKVDDGDVLSALSTALSHFDSKGKIHGGIRCKGVYD